MLQIESALLGEKKYTPIYFDLQDKASLPLGQVLYQIAQKISLITKTSLPERGDFDQDGNFFRKEFITSVVEGSENNGLVLLFDEFDVLDNPQLEKAGASIFPYLRRWMETAENVQFVFVLGRRPEELSTNTMSAFKTIGSRQISLMSKDDSKTIILQSERNGSLKWNDTVVERIWYWTQGHPYFTQLLCSEIWESCIDEELEKTSDNPGQVDSAIERALEQGANAFQWIWTGLPPSERMVMAAMAEAKGESIDREELTEILNRSKVRLILRELELAPDTLIRWDLLRKVEKGYRFAIPLLRRWVVSEKPLGRVKAELDSIEPLAESLYTSGEGFYKMGNFEEAGRQLRNALNVNPNHFRARLLLGQVLIGQGKPEEAVKELEPAYRFDSISAKPGLIGALLALAETQSKNDQLPTYDRILAMEPDQSVALEKKRGIQIMIRKQELKEQLFIARDYERNGDWLYAIEIYEKLLTEFPDEDDWQANLETARAQNELAKTYSSALDAFDRDKKELAQRLLGKVVGIDPTYRDALRYLTMSVKKIDIEDLVQKSYQLETRFEIEKNTRNISVWTMTGIEYLSGKRKYQQEISVSRMLLSVFPRIFRDPKPHDLIIKPDCCPECGGNSTAYSELSGNEKILMHFFPRSPFDCKDCRKRFWIWDKTFFQSLLFIVGIVSGAFIETNNVLSSKYNSILLLGGILCAFFIIRLVISVIVDSIGLYQKLTYHVSFSIFSGMAGGMAGGFGYNLRTAWE